MKRFFVFVFTIIFFLISAFFVLKYLRHDKNDVSKTKIGNEIQIVNKVDHSDFEYPHGVYCSCPRTSSDGKSISVLPNIAEKDFVDGIFVRIWWSDLEPVEGKTNWKLLDDQIAEAKKYGKKVALAVLSGPRAPEWVFSKGAQSVKYSVQFQDVKMPLPWDSIYLSEWFRFIREFGKRYNDNETVVLIHMTASTKNGLEMQQPNELKTAPGFEISKIVDATKKTMDVFSQSFPDKFLDIDLHPVLDDNTVSQKIAEYGHGTIGKKFGIFAAWWNDKNIDLYKKQYDLLADSARISFGAVQLASTESSYLSFLIRNQIDVKKSIELARENNIHYFEVWSNDLQNKEFENYFRSFLYEK